MSKSSILRKASYIPNLEAAIKRDDNHPYHHGFKMQAHHLLSRNGFFKVGSDFASDVDSIGYDINVAQNLVFLPSELEGACHLHVPLHRGNHTYSDHNDQDDDVDPPYHLKVKSLLEKHAVKLVKDCKVDCSKPSKRKDKVDELNDLLDDLSATMLKRIADYKVALNRMHRAFKLGNPCGCSNLKNVGSSDAHCKHDRNHKGDLKHRSTGKDIDYPSIQDTNGKPLYKLKIYGKRR